MKYLAIIPILLMMSFSSCQKSKVLSDNKQKVELLYNPSNMDATEEQGIADAKKDFENGNHVKIFFGMIRDPFYNQQLLWAKDILEKENNIIVLYGDDALTVYKTSYNNTMKEQMKKLYSDDFFDQVLKRAEKEFNADFNKQYEQYKKEHPEKTISKEDFIFEYQKKEA